jgi:hypothetical protein
MFFLSSRRTDNRTDTLYRERVCPPAGSRTSGQVVRPLSRAIAPSRAGCPDLSTAVTSYSLSGPGFGPRQNGSEKKRIALRTASCVELASTGVA